VREAALERTKLGLLVLAVQLACTAPNPAYRPGVALPDAGQAEAEAGAPKLFADAAVTAPDAPLPDDAAPDLAGAPDLAANMVEPRPAGLVAHWRLDEPGGNTALDERGLNPGTLTNGTGRVSVGFPSARFENPGAVSFDGLDDYVALGIRELPAMQAVKSVSVWFRADSLSTTARRNLVVFNNRAAEESWQLGLERGYPAVWTWGPTPARLIGVSRMDLQWHHLVYVFDGTTQRLYLDGTAAATLGQAPPSATVAAAYLGTYDPTDDDGERWSGVIDDVRIYDQALTPEQIAWLAAGND
jgi:hypothetical protein